MTLIVTSRQMNPSLASANPNDVVLGQGQYFSDILPGTRTCSQLSRVFLGFPFQRQRFTNFIAVDITGMTILAGRAAVFLHPSIVRLSLVGRLKGFGVN